jgi:hypothetical protein
MEPKAVTCPSDVNAQRYREAETKWLGESRLVEDEITFYAD